MSVSGPASEPSVSNPYNEILAQSERQHRLLSVQWELTYRCNEKCTHCYLDVFAPNAKVPGELSTEECFRVVDQMAELGVLNLTLSGGEILVRRDIFQIAEYARSKKFLLRLFTNGILIKPDVADRIAALHPYQVELSLYSANSETHDKITQRKRSWELTTRAVRLLRERGIRVLVKSPLMRENVHEFGALEALVKELGAQFHFDTTITPKDSGGLEPLRHRVTQEELIEFYRERIDASTLLTRAINDNTRTCGISLNALAIDPYGNIFPCLQTRFNAGNLREKTLREIWERSPVWQQIGHLTLGQLPVCRTCELRTLCVRCHGLALAEDGDLYGPALVNCREALARRQALIDRGDLPADYPVPAHLQQYASVTHSMSQLDEGSASFIPLSTLKIVNESEFAVARQAA